MGTGSDWSVSENGDRESELLETPFNGEQCVSASMFAYCTHSHLSKHIRPIGRIQTFYVSLLIMAFDLNDI